MLQKDKQHLQSCHIDHKLFLLTSAKLLNGLICANLETVQLHTATGWTNGCNECHLKCTYLDEHV